MSTEPFLVPDDDYAEDANFEYERHPIDPDFDLGGRSLAAIRNGARVQDVPLKEAQLVSSVLAGQDLADPSSIHRLVVDVDVPIRIVPSSTPGHSHLYIDKGMTWDQVRRLLKAFVDAELVEHGYYAASLQRSCTHVRLPWIKKPSGEEHL